MLGTTQLQRILNNDDGILYGLNASNLRVVAYTIHWGPPRCPQTPSVRKPSPVTPNGITGLGFIIQNFGFPVKNLLVLEIPE